MENNVAVALISAGGSLVTAITAIVLSDRRLGGIDKRNDDTNRCLDELCADMTARFDRIDATLELIRHELGSHAVDIARLKDKNNFS